MLKKWADKYKEEDFAYNKFDPWGPTKFTRVEANKRGHGGTPTDNNGLEGKNGGQKGDRGHSKEGTVMFCYTTHLVNGGRN